MMDDDDTIVNLSEHHFVTLTYAKAAVQFGACTLGHLAAHCFNVASSTTLFLTKGGVLYPHFSHKLQETQLRKDVRP